ARDGPQRRVHPPGRRRHPRALDAHQVQPTRRIVRPPHGAGAGPVNDTPMKDTSKGMIAPVPATPARRNWVALGTIVRREFTRILRIWAQTLVPPAITMTL